MADPQTRPRGSFSSPPSLNGEKKRSWFASAKALFTRHSRPRPRPRPRPRRSPKRHAPPSSSSLELPNRTPLQGFPNFSRLSPLGGRAADLGGQRTEVEEYAPPRNENKPPAEELKIPEGQQPSRPPLSNLFAMYKTEAKAKETLKADIKLREKPANIKIDVNMDGVKHMRRHSTPITPSFPLSVPYQERRESASSDTSMDQSRLQRRAKRASLTRCLPQLPKRGEDPLRPLPKNTSPPVSPYSEYSGAPILHTTPPQDPPKPGEQLLLHFGPSDEPLVPPKSGEQLLLCFGPNDRPPVSPGGAESKNFSYPPTWHQQLKELQEELEDDGEGDGEEGMIDEAEEPQENIMPMKAWGELSKGKGKEGGRGEGGEGGGKFGKLFGIRSSKRAIPHADKRGVATGEKTKKVEEDKEEIKGFDGFFMY